jgi:general stress protein 26
MDKETLSRAVALSGELEVVFLATADADGVPHLAAAEKLKLLDDECVGVKSWYCPGTINNLQDNPNVAIVIWDKNSDHGYQLQGVLEGADDLAIMDGFSAEAEARNPLPEIEKQLRVRVDKIVAFRRMAHSDVEE